MEIWLQSSTTPRYCSKAYYVVMPLSPSPRPQKLQSQTRTKLPLSWLMWKDFSEQFVNHENKYIVWRLPLRWPKASSSHTGLKPTNYHLQQVNLWHLDFSLCSKKKKKKMVKQNTKNAQSIPELNYRFSWHTY